MVTIRCIILVMPAFFFLVATFLHHVFCTVFPSIAYKLLGNLVAYSSPTGKCKEGQECESQIPQVNKSIHKCILHWLWTPRQWLTVSKRGADCHALPVKWYFVVWCWHPTHRSLPHAHVVDIEYWWSQSCWALLWWFFCEVFFPLSSLLLDIFFLLCCS